MKGYFVYKGTEFYNYDLYKHSSYPNGDRLFRGNTDDKIVFDDGVANLVKNPASLLDPNFKPSKGDSIWITPKCPLAAADIRKNYAVKRDPKDAVCAVFAGQSNYGDYTCIRRVYIIPKFKTILCADTNMSIWSLIDEFIPDKKGQINTEDWIEKFLWGDHGYFLSKENMPILKILNKEITVPCIDYTQLDINTEMPLTSDVMELVYKTATQSYSETDAEKNLVIQLNALNQYNWRERKMSISVLWEIIGRCTYPYPIWREMRNHKTRYSKPVQQLLSFKGVTTFSNKEDFELSKSFVDMLLKINGIQFTDAATLLTKINEVGLSLDTFSKFYKNIIRLTPTVYEEKSA